MRSYLTATSLAVLTASMLAFAQQPPAGGGQPPAQQQPMSFFVTSAGPGNGANLGGLAGADRHCQTLAQAAGGGSKTWRAYLSASASGGQAAVNARDRIGPGPWYNAKSARIAQNVADLHGDTLEAARRGNNLTKVTALNEKGETVNGVGDTPNRHDILTGSQLDGSAFTDGADHTCQNWTATVQALRRSVITIERAAGVHRGTLLMPVADAVKRIWSARAARVFSIASPSIDLNWQVAARVLNFSRQSLYRERGPIRGRSPALHVVEIVPWTRRSC